MYLLDTNVVSELRRPRPHGAVVAWIQAAEEAHLYLSAVTIGEVQAGIELTRDQDAVKAKELEAWADQLAGSYNVLPMDAPCIRRCAKLMHPECDAAYEDAMLAATAHVHRLTIVTCNVHDFARFEIATLDPSKQFVG
jgi:predicted nucleic acid-binding protein